MLHEEAPEVFYGWADQRARARFVCGFSRVEAANSTLHTILEHHYGRLPGGMEVWVAWVDDSVGKSTGWKVGSLTEDQLAPVYVAALVKYLKRLTAPDRPKTGKKQPAPS